MITRRSLFAFFAAAPAAFLLPRETTASYLIRRLNALPEPLRSAVRDGNWKVSKKSVLQQKIDALDRAILSKPGFGQKMPLGKMRVTEK